MAIFSHKRPVESFLVALAAQTAMPTSGTISDSTTFDVNLVNGQLGVAAAGIYGSVAMNTFLGATPTMAQAPEIRILQGTPHSVNTSTYTAQHPLTVRAYEQSSLIDGRGTVSITKQLYRAPEHDVTVIGNTVGEADAVNILDETAYEVAIGFRGYRIQENYSSEEASYLRAKVTTPDFTTLGYTDAQATDWILTKLAWDINKNSSAFVMDPRRPNKAPILALLIDTTGSDGTLIYDGGLNIAAGDSLSVVSTSNGLRNITLTQALVDSIEDAAVEATGDVIANCTWSILTIDVTDAGLATGGLGDVLMLIALDETTVYVDDVAQVKVRTDVSLPLGFDIATVRNLRANALDEGEGTARQMELLYRKTQGQRKYNLDHESFPIPTHTSPILSTETYNVYNILHTNYHSVDIINNAIGSPFRDIVLIPSSNTTLVTNFDNLFNAWLGSTANQQAIVTLS